MKMRTWKCTRLSSEVSHWSWTRASRLWCWFKDGTKFRSEYRTLREFEQAVRERRELAYEDTKG